ncbi:hypothetical protein FRC08_002864 [Ceratobasidium sp. 394]|nr:hypothetical protein FRC08_002864 [Ceratobasidium sp. 394]
MPTDPVAPTPTIEFIFHGTGTSSSVPNISCLTADPITCETCGSTLTPQGQKNKRRNTGGILRILRDGEQPERVIVIDVGKTFLSAAHDLFPRYGLRRIDAVLLTHPHADAMNGLDDLRGWTLNGNIQDHIDIYVSAFTFKEVQRSFPYLVAKEFATGGGDIPEFRWHIIKENEPFRIEGVDFDITPIAVHHGRLFTNDEAGPPGFTPTPNVTPGISRAATPSKSYLGLSSIESLDRRSSQTPLQNDQSLRSSEATHITTPQPHSLLAKPKPYMCFGFIIGDFMVYISDVSFIPQDAWQTIELSVSNNNGQGAKLDESMANLSMNGTHLARQKGYKLLVIDCLKLEPHTSHFGLKGTVETARRLNAKRAYMVGFGHGIPHWDWLNIGKRLGGKDLGESEAHRPHVMKALEMVPPKKGEDIWVQPAYDGLRLFANKTDVWDEESE